ncbi:MAG: hypothetical protein R2762_10845 [Bryobacteraceae bacterium]
MQPRAPFLLVAVHAAATWFMTGLVWFVQMVHYPLFSMVDGAGFAAYEQAHTVRTTWVVAPVMLIELATALLLFRYRMPRGELMLGAGLLAVVWGSTFLLQVPRHEILSMGFDDVAHGGLVATNWIRTVAWSARGVVAMRMLNANFRSSPRGAG